MITVGKLVNQSLPQIEYCIKNISNIGLNTIKVEMASDDSANKLIDNKFLKEKGYEALYRII